MWCASAGINWGLERVMRGFWIIDRLRCVQEALSHAGNDQVRQMLNGMSQTAYETKKPNTRVTETRITERQVTEEVIRERSTAVTQVMAVVEEPSQWETDDNQTS